MSDLHAFVRRLADVVATREPAALRSPLAVGEIQSRMMPYRSCRRALGLRTAEEYELLLLRLVAEESGLARTFPSESAERCRVEVAAVLPDLAFLQQLQEVTILLNLRALDAAPAPSAAVASPEERVEESSPADHEAPVPTDGAMQDSPAHPVGVETAPETGTLDPIDEPSGHPLASGESATPAPAQPVEAVVPPIDPTPAHPVPTESPAGSEAAAPPRECPHCARTLPQGRPVRFCPSCGQNVRVRLCASCRSEMELDWRHCVMCGHAAPDTHRFA